MEDDAMARAIKSASHKLAGAKEALLCEAVRLAIGDSCDILEAIKGHDLRFVVTPGGVETFCVDGKGIVEFHPVKITTKCDGRMSVDLNYRMLI